MTKRNEKLPFLSLTQRLVFSVSPDVLPLTLIHAANMLIKSMFINESNTFNFQNVTVGDTSIN